MSHYPSQLLTLIAYLKKLPGVGRKTAERFAFQLLEWPEGEIQKFSATLESLQKKIHFCIACGCLKEHPPCPFCQSSGRDPSTLCVVSNARDVYAMEETKAFKGLYHVIGLLSPLEGKAIEQKALNTFEARFDTGSIQEVILAFDSTLEGDATALFLKEKLSKKGIKATRLAFGLPMGSSLDYVDYGTLEKAFTGRQTF